MIETIKSGDTIYNKYRSRLVRKIDEKLFKLEISLVRKWKVSIFNTILSETYKKFHDYLDKEIGLKSKGVATYHTIKDYETIFCNKD